MWNQQDSSVSKDIVIQSAPSAPAAIEGPATSCAGSQNYFSPGSGSATLSWSLNPSNAGLSAVQVTQLLLPGQMSFRAVLH